MKIKVYEYKNCDTCKKALQFLDAKKVSYAKIPIVENPPDMTELKVMLEFIKKDGGTFKNLFNTSGVQYRELKISDQIKTGLTELAALKILSKNGKLVKRPFVLTGDHGFVGYKKDIWEKYWMEK